MLQKTINLRISGERPTRAGLVPRTEVSVSSATGNGSMGQNQGWSQRAVSRWSDRDEFLRFRSVAGREANSSSDCEYRGAERLRRSDEDRHAERSLHVFTGIGEQESNT